MNRERAERLKSKLLGERKKYKNDQEFAEKLGGVRVVTLNKWLNATPAVWPDPVNLAKIAAYFGKDIESLTAPVIVGKVKEITPLYGESDVTVEAVMRMINRLSNEDRREVIVQTAQALTV